MAEVKKQHESSQDMDEQVDHEELRIARNYLSPLIEAGNQYQGAAYELLTEEKGLRVKFGLTLEGVRTLAEKIVSDQDEDIKSALRKHGFETLVT